MTTDDKYLNIVEKRLLGSESFKDYFLEYLQSIVTELASTTYARDTTIDPSSKVVISASGNDEIDLTTGKKGTDGSGHFMVTESTYCTNVVFENANSTEYNVGIKYCVLPDGIEINPRTGYPDYKRWQEFMGESGEPSSVVDLTSIIQFDINSICPGNRDYSGRKCMVWKNIPAIGATSESLAYEILTVNYTGGHNTITTSVSGTLGQSTVSTTTSDYTVVLLGPSIARTADIDYESESDYWFIGVMDGSGAGSPPTIPNDSIDLQRISQYSLSDLIENWFTKLTYRGEHDDIYNWTTHIVDGVTTTVTIKDIWYGGGKYFGVDSTYQTYLSTHGISWLETASTPSVDARGGTYDGTRWIVCGSNPPSYGIDYTTDLRDTNWTHVSFGAVAFNAIAYGSASSGAQYVCVGNTGNIWTATDPTGTWTSRTSGTTEPIVSVAYSEELDLWVAISTTKILTASDPTGTWTSRSYSHDGVGASEVFRQVIWSNAEGYTGNFIIVGRYQYGGDYNAIIFTSPDGITWTQRKIPEVIYKHYDDLYGIATDGNRTIAIGGRFIMVLTLDNGATWSELPSIYCESSSGASQYFGPIATSGQNFVICGDAGGGVLFSSMTRDVDQL